MVSDDLARRFLHVNLNCESMEATEELYSGLLGLSARMRTDPNVATNGAMLGIDDETYCSTVFFYDMRGPRDGCSLEAIAFQTPALARDQRTDPTRPGIRAALMRVADLDTAVVALGKAGVQVGEPVDGLISGAKSVLALAHDGVVIELAQAPSDLDASASALFSGIRIAAIDIRATAQFLTAIGFIEVEAPTTIPVSANQLAPGGSADSVE